MDFQHIIYRIRYKRSFKNASMSWQNKNHSTNYEFVFNFPKYLQIYYDSSNSSNISKQPLDAFKETADIKVVCRLNLVLY